MYNKERAIRTYKNNEGKEVSKEITICSGIGRFTADSPQAREVIANGTTTKVIGEYGFSIAFNQGKDKPAQFFRLEAWGKTAEFLEAYAKKGLSAYVFGRVETRSYTNKENEEVKYDVLVVENFRTIRGQAPKQEGSKDNQDVEMPEATGFEELGEFDDIPF